MSAFGCRALGLKADIAAASVNVRFSVLIRKTCGACRIAEAIAGCAGSNSAGRAE
jgi:hypothetical protein